MGVFMVTRLCHPSDNPMICSACECFAIVYLLFKERMRQPSINEASIKVYPVTFVRTSATYARGGLGEVLVGKGVKIFLRNFVKS